MTVRPAPAPSPDERGGLGAPSALLLQNWRRAGVRAPSGHGGRAPGRWHLRLDGALIREVAPELTPLPGEQVIDLGGAYLAPGLVDCHVHLTRGGIGTRENARAHLAAGITAVRSLGDQEPPGELERAAADRGVWEPLPVTVFAGRALAPAGRYGGFLGREVQPGERLGRLVEEEVARGARVIKVILSGSVDFARAAAEGPYFSERELAEIVAAARSLAVPVACHANGSRSVRLAAAAGVDSLEHGILAGDEGLRAMAEAGVCWVPTLTPLHSLAAGGRWLALPGILRDHAAAVSRGVELGLSILPGTDAGSPGVPHGSLPTELALLTRAGLAGEGLLAAATWRAADLLRLPSGYGRLSPGARTDLVWFREDPFSAAASPGPALGALVAGRLVAGSDAAGN